MRCEETAGFRVFCACARDLGPDTKNCSKLQDGKFALLLIRAFDEAKVKG